MRNHQVVMSYKSSGLWSHVSNYQTLGYPGMMRRPKMQTQDAVRIVRGM